MDILRRLFGYLRPHLKTTAVVLILMSGATGLDLVSPWLLRQVFDKGIAGKQYSLVIWCSIGFVLIYAVRGVLNYTWGFLMERTGQRVILRMRNEAYEHMQGLSFGFFDKHQTGQVMSRLVGDVEAIRNFVSWGFTELVMAALTFTVTVVIFFVIDWKLALILIIPTPFLIACVLLFGKRIRPAWDRVREQMGKLTSVLQENVTGIRAVKAFSREPEQNALFDDRNRQSYKGNLERATIEANAFPLMDLLSGITFLLLVWVGAPRVAAGTLSLGTFMALQWWVWGLVWPVRQAGWLMDLMQQALAAAPRVFEIMDARAEVKDTSSEVTAPRFEGHVRFEDVRFTFPDGGELLRSLSFEAKPGQMVALIGGTGSGKSMVMNLLPRFYDVSSGRVTIDGIDVRDVSVESLRRQIGIVMQETFLFSSSIRDNIAYGRPDATLDDVIEAAMVADIHDFVSGLEQGYDTKVGERGIGLSGGQRQRIALARALIMNPRILLLDEAMASVDTATERNIQNALNRAMQGRTTLVIAQRLSTVKHADMIAVLEGGRITQAGTHESLMREDGYYRSLFDMQFGAGAGFPGGPVGEVAESGV